MHHASSFAALVLHSNSLLSNVHIVTARQPHNNVFHPVITCHSLISSLHVLCIHILPSPNRTLHQHHPSFTVLLLPLPNQALVQTWQLSILLIHHRNLNCILPRLCLMVGLECPSWMAIILPTFVDLSHQNFSSYTHSHLLLSVHYPLSLVLSSVLSVYTCFHFMQQQR